MSSERLLNLAPWLLFSGSALFLLLFNDSTMLYGLDETKNAQCAREMLMRGDWIVPTFNGQLRTDKPPLHYFFMGLAYRLFGISEFSARFFSGIFGALTILLTFGFGCRHLGTGAGWLSALSLLASLHYSIQMRMSVPDPYLVFWMTGTSLAAFEGVETRQKRWFYFAYVTAAFGMLTKGPVAVALPGLTLFLYITLTRQWSWALVRAAQLPVGILLWGVIALPWYVAVHQQTNGAWTDGFFFKHNLERFSAPMEGHGGFFGLPLVFVLVGMLPFSVFLPIALGRVWKVQTAHPLLTFCLLAAGVIVLFFMASGTKLPNYTVPAYPFVALLLGFGLNDLYRRLPQRVVMSVTLATLMLITLLLPPAISLLLHDDLMLSDLWWLGLLFLPFPAGAMFSWFYWSRRNLNGVMGAMAVSWMACAWVLFGYAYGRVDARNPVVQLNHLIHNQPLVAYKLFNPAFVYYRQPVTRKAVPGLSEAQYRFLPVADPEQLSGLRIFDQPDSLRSFLTRHPYARVITRKEFLQEIETDSLPILARQPDLFERSVTVILGK